MTAPIDAQIARLEKKLQAADLLLKSAVDEIEDAVAEVVADADVEAEAHAEIEIKDKSGVSHQLRIARPRKKVGPFRAKADYHLREIALRLAAEHPEGFVPMEVVDDFRLDESIPQEVRNTSENYVYQVLNRLRFEGKLDKRANRYVLAGTITTVKPVESADGVPAGFKIVPQTKEEKIKDEVTRYLRRARGSTAHRAQLAERLISVGLFEPSKHVINRVSIYMSKWPTEFKADGKGNYTYTPPEKTNGDP